MTRDIMAQVLGDPPYRHLAYVDELSQPDADALAEAREDIHKTPTILDADGTAAIDRMIQRDRPAHRALPRERPMPTTQDTQEAPPSRQWLMPTRHLKAPSITLNQVLELFLGKGLTSLMTTGKETLWVGVALEDDDTLIIERCTEREAYARRIDINKGGRLTGGNYYRYALEAAGWESGRYPVTLDRERRVATAQRCDRQPFDVPSSRIDTRRVDPAAGTALVRRG